MMRNIFAALFVVRLPHFEAILVRTQVEGPEVEQDAVRERSSQRREEALEDASKFLNVFEVFSPPRGIAVAAFLLWRPTVSVEPYPAPAPWLLSRSQACPC